MQPKMHKCVRICKVLLLIIFWMEPIVNLSMEFVQQPGIRLLDVVQIEILMCIDALLIQQINVSLIISTSV